MRNLRVSAIAVGLFVCTTAILPAQERRVVVEKLGSADKELKRSAYRLHIPPDQLRNVREALQEATDLAVRLEPSPPPQAAQLGHEWVRLNRSKAKGMIESIIERLRTQAAEARNPAMYQQVTMAAGPLISQLSALDTEKSLRLIRNWPESPGADKDNSGNPGRPETQLKRQLLQQVSYQNPDLALQLMKESPDIADYITRGQVAQRLIAGGRKEEGVRLLDQALSDFSSRPVDFQSLIDFQSYLGNLSRSDSDRFLASLPAWLDAAKKSAIAPGASLIAGDREVVLSPAESMTLNMLRSLQFGRAGLFMKTLDLVPELKAKADSVGGIDVLLSAQMVFRNPTDGSAGPSRRTGYAGGAPIRVTSGVSGPPSEVLYQELRAKQTRDPGKFKDELGELARDPEKVRLLLDFASRASYDDPDAAATALETAQPAILRMEPLSRKAEMYQYLVRAWRQCDGEVERGLLREGFIIADDMRQEARRAEATVPATGVQAWSPADSLEAMVLAELSRTSFDLAMRHVRSLPDGQLKFNALLQIIQAVSQP